ncbi:hypothetical protein F5Y10DRAFT_237977 [Nemania abortiva]|nr:hypothetical protein F5Y10DRAFT_237977 [Nemania abortiva]
MSFLRFTCVQCTRRLGRLAQSSKSLNDNPLILRQLTPPTPRLSRKHTPLLSPRCPYSTAPSRSRGRAVPTRDFFARARLTLADVPPLEFWAEQIRSRAFTDLNADECLQTAQFYVAAAVKDTPGWKERLITTGDTSITPSPDGRGVARAGAKAKAISVYTLHYVAIILLMANLSMPMVMHILHTLTGLDYTPSILTMARLGLQGRALHKPQFEPAFEGLERILRRIDSSNNKNSTSKSTQIDLAADACTLRALIYEAENTHEGDNNALRWFRRAYEIDAAASKSRPHTTPPTTTDQADVEKAQEGNEAMNAGENTHFDPHWQWKISFALGVARIHLRRGKTAKALAMYEAASSEFDSAQGYLGIADVLEQMGEADTDRYAECLEKAAISGNREAARKMGAREFERAAEDGLSKRERRERQAITEEWMAISDVSDLAEEVGEVLQPRSYRTASASD